MTAPLVDPRETAFFATDPSRRITEQPPPVQVPDYRASSRRLIELGVALGAAFLVYRKYTSMQLRNSPPPPMNTDRARHVKAIIRKSPFWVQLSVPIIKEAIELGNVSQLSSVEVEVIAQSYAEDMGEYINQTSGDALVEGFESQLQKRWSDTVAWHRASSAFGLDRQQMRAFMQNVMDTQEQANFDLLPDKAQAFLYKALTDRADRIGSHEVWQAKSAGKAIAWLTQQKNGLIPVDAEKQWITAEDEMVCPQCGPLHKQRIALDERWKTPDGNEYWAPGVHPNCRCDIHLIYPEITNDMLSAVNDFEYVQKDMPGDAHDRDKRGRFARVESRGQKPFKEQEIDPVLDNFLLRIREGADQLEEVIKPAAKNPFASDKKAFNPFGNEKVANPFEQTAAVNPFTQQSANNPFESKARNPFDAKVVNPFEEKKPAARRKKIVNDDIIVVINGQKQKAQTVNYGDEILSKPIFVWAADHYGMSENADVTSADLVAHLPGTTVNFNYASAVDTGVQTYMSGKVWDGNFDAIANGAASGIYDDWADWENPSAQSISNAYNHAHDELTESIINNQSVIAMRLDPQEIRKVMQDSGRHADGDIGTARDLLASAPRNSQLFHALSNHMQQSHTNSELINTVAARELISLRVEMQQMGLVMHTPSIFIIEDQSSYNMPLDLDAQTVAVEGNYRVVNTYKRDAAIDMGYERPPGIKAINVVYLEPADDDEDYRADPIYGSFNPTDLEDYPEYDD